MNVCTYRQSTGLLKSSLIEQEQESVGLERQKILSRQVLINEEGDLIERGGGR